MMSTIFWMGENVIPDSNDIEYCTNLVHPQLDFSALLMGESVIFNSNGI